MNPDQILYQIGIPEAFRMPAARLYDSAFAKKFSVAIKDSKDRHELFSVGFNLDFAVGAISQGRILGIAGFHTEQGSLTGSIGYQDLISTLGFLKGNQAAVVFSLYERSPSPGVLLMDGIAVRASARGLGIGSRMLRELADYAQQHGYNSIQLDVVDTNPRAEMLYRRLGFRPVKVETFPYLKPFLGFGGVTTMELNCTSLDQI